MWSRRRVVGAGLALAAGPPACVMVPRGHTTAAERRIDFAGRTWSVRRAPRRVSPGPNHFDDGLSSVEVRADHALQLAVRKAGRRWTCAEVSTTLPAGPVQVEVHLRTDPESLDPRVVLGLFAYADDEHEVDIEFSRWGYPHRPWNAQYAVAPYGEGRVHRFRWAGTGGVHLFDWREDRVAFESRRDGRIREEWRYTAPLMRSMRERSFRLHLNLWLAGGKAPLGHKDVEVVIDDVVVR